MGLRPLEIFQFFRRGDRLSTSESDVFTRQILTCKDVPHAERGKTADVFCQMLIVNQSSHCQVL